MPNTLTPSQTLEQVFTSLRSKRFDLSSEKVLQGEIEATFRAANVNYEREVALSAADIIDFMAGGVGIEVKIKGTPKAIYKQLERYCASPRVERLLLITNKAIALPGTINGKHTYILNLGLAWL